MKLFPPHITDFYKTGHRVQYPPNTELVYSNFTCRSDRWASVLPDFDHRVVFFGLQGICQWMLIDLWNKEFFQQPREWCVEKYRRRMDSALGPGAVSAEHIGALHDLGYLPVLIKALPEGSRVNLRVPMWTIQNTLPEFYWVTNYLETQLSAEQWKVITSATTAYEYRRLIDRYARETGSPQPFVLWQGHDFSMRGLSGIHDSAQSGAGHLLSFTGTDTITAIDYLEDYYPSGDEFIGGSVPATEHSVMCMWGPVDECGAMRHLITKTYPNGFISIVADTWDFWKVITEYAVELKPEIMARAGRVVFRPDSGDPVKIICGDPGAPPGSPERKGAVECLWDIFGGITSKEGFRTLDDHVGLIYGDSITLDRAFLILSGLKAKGFSAGNIVFGVGSYTYQHVTRDNFGTAIKATAGRVHGEGRELFKDPKTDVGIKKSARGLIRVDALPMGGFQATDRQTALGESEGLLQPVFANSTMMKMWTLKEVRQNLYPVA